jgi:hypothetical protein
MRWINGGRLVAGLVVVLIQLLVVGAANAGTSPALFNRETYNYTTTLTTSQEANRYQIMVLQSTDASKVGALKAANPNLKILVYMGMMESSTTDPTGMTTCTPYSTDNSSHPSWFLNDQNGQRIIDNGYPGNYIMDVGNTGYQQACLAHGLAVAKQGGFDGIYMDEVNAWVGWYFQSGVTAPEYPTIPSWQAATFSLLAYGGPAAHAQHLLAIANIGGATLTTGLWQKWTTPLDGSEEEAWTDGGLGLAQQISGWPTKLANAAWSESHGKYAILHSYNTTRPGNTYGLASMMLVAGGESSYATSNNTSYEAWYREYTTAQHLGVPAGAYKQLTNGVYERVFANGIVLVNPTATAVPSFSLGGGIYTGSGVTSVKTVQMGATSGLILIRVG